ncbi:MAG: hypothetical protein V1839_02625 [archaeon]
MVGELEFTPAQALLNGKSIDDLFEDFEKKIPVLCGETARDNRILYT